MKPASVLKTLVPLPLALSCSLALAQDQSGDSGMDAILEEVLVTATRRVSDLQTTPVAVTALSGQELDQRWAELRQADPIDLRATRLREPLAAGKPSVHAVEHATSERARSPRP